MNLCRHLLQLWTPIELIPKDIYGSSFHPMGLCVCGWVGRDRYDTEYDPNPNGSSGWECPYFISPHVQEQES